MINYCPECGLQLEKEYKFCPNCGHDLKNLKENITKKEAAEVIICENCGEENLPEKDICGSCGAKLKGEKIRKELAVNKNFQAENKEKKNPHKKVDINSQAVRNVKSLEGQKLFLIVFAGVVVVILVLILSGTFNSPPNRLTQSMMQGQPQIESGVNLSNMNRINELQSVANNNPDDFKTLLELAYLKNDSGLFEKAIEDYQKYLKKNPEDPNARVDMGVCYYNLGEYEKAIEEMKKALEYVPMHQIAHLNLGIVNLASGNIQASKEWLQKTVNINPNSEIGIRAKELLESH